MAIHRVHYVSMKDTEAVTETSPGCHATCAGDAQLELNWLAYRLRHSGSSTSSHEQHGGVIAVHIP